MLICLLHHLNYAHGLPDILPRPGDESEAFTLHACSSSSPTSVATNTGIEPSLKEANVFSL